jgi:dTDP-4-amino-4,6-dideoxygalactose transaminase
VGDAKLRQRIREIQNAWRRQPRSSYAAKIAKVSMMLPLQRPRAYGLFSRLCVAAGSSSGAVVRKFTRGFGSHDTAALLQALRQQPCAPLLAMLAWRLTTEDGRRVARRAEIGEQIIASLADLPEARVSCIGYGQTCRTHWLLPISVPDPEALRRDLARAGVDAHGASNVVAIGGKRATAMVDGLVFVPCYPELTDDARARVCEVVRAHCLSHS